MTVTVFPSRPEQARPLLPRHPPSHRRSSSTRLIEDPTLTVSFQITLTGDNRFVDAAEVLDTLRQVTSRLDGAEVDVTPALALAPPVWSVDVPITEVASDPVQVLVETREVRQGARTIPFTRIEFDLLRFLAEHPRQVFTREQLLRHVWGFAHGGHRTVDVHIRRLRVKFRDRKVATTVRGIGYRLADDANVRVVRLT
jgi:DNA-binding response OmpR family regulator